ncbi:MAG TPA: hypothetical protein VMR70_00710 [Flavisolibacter sp.]|nr:hypothetical protein [Flavisolibacter sp.]
MTLGEPNEFRELKPNTLVAELVEFIEKQLPDFSNSLEFIKILEKKKNENQHSLSFCVYMTNKCNSKFYFARENSQKGPSTIDIGVYKGPILLFTIEAKLLPTPQGSKGNEREEHEYVYGRGAGIQRFKDGNHGRDNVDQFIPENGMLGLIKDQDFEFWLEKVNQWIRDINWESSEALQKNYFNSVAKLKSKHKRVNGPEVLLHHFWIKVN